MWNTIKIYLLKIVSFLRLVTVDIAGLLMYICSLANNVLLTNFLLQRACEVNLHYPKENCTQMVEIHGQGTDKNPLEEEAQAVVASIISVKSILENSLLVPVIVFFGQWSDRNGRKLPLVISSSCGFLHSVITIICIYYPNFDAYTVGLLSSIPRAVLGSDILFQMAAYSYLTDMTSELSRTARLGMLGAAITLGVPFGMSIAGFMLNMQWDYTVCFAISGSFSLLSSAIIVLGVKNNAEELQLKISQTAQTDEASGCCLPLSRTYSALKELLKVPFKRRAGSKRLEINLLLVVMYCVLTPIYGEFSVMYLFVRNRFQWDPLEFGYFSTFRLTCQIIGTSVMMGLFSHKLRVPDPILGFVAAFSQYGCSSIYIFATSTWLMYVAPIVEFSQSTLHVVSRAMLTKLIEPTEVGKLSSIISIIEVMNPLVMAPLYSFVYQKTLNTFPGAVFMISFGIVVPAQLIYLWFIGRSSNPVVPTEESETSPLIPNGNTIENS